MLYNVVKTRKVYNYSVVSSAGLQTFGVYQLYVRQKQPIYGLCDISEVFPRSGLFIQLFFT